MTLFQAVVLGLVQGLTEFLPISSSAHLILLPRALGWEDQGLVFDVAAHGGTLVAVLVYFRAELGSLGGATWRRLARRSAPLEPPERLFWQLALATLPVAAVGWLAQDLIATQGRNPRLIALACILFAGLLGLAERWGRKERALDALRLRDVVIVGLAQALALIPGTSRSGITVTAGLFLHLDREASVRFSFLLAIPVLILAALKDLVDVVGGGVERSDWIPLLLLTVVSGLCGYLVMGALLAFSRRQSLHVFVVYRVLLGLGILALAQ